MEKKTKVIKTAIENQEEEKKLTKESIQASANEQTFDPKLKPIFFYKTKDPYGYFSNFYPSPINIDGKVWPTTEHFFQAMKFPEKPEYQEKLRANKNPAIAFRMGRGKGLREDWASVKNEVMERALLAKFTQNNELRSKLMETGEALLVEHTKRDNYWGDGGDGGDGSAGRNNLGKMLCKLRHQFR